MNDERLLSEVEVEAIYGIKRRLLQQWRHRRVGPPFIKLGSSKASPVRYKKRDLEKYLEDNTVETKGSEGSGRSTG